MSAIHQRAVAPKERLHDRLLRVLREFDRVCPDSGGDADVIRAALTTLIGKAYAACPAEQDEALEREAAAELIAFADVVEARKAKVTQCA